MAALDCPEAPIRSQPVKCDGPLNFARLIQAQFRTEDAVFALPGINPFNLPEASEIVDSIKSDLNEIRGELPGLSSAFLTDPGSRVELVGVINRMDRQFLSEQMESDCGEISARH
jgi:hypothetical protein